MSNCPFKVGETYPLRGGGTAEILKVDVGLTSGKSIVGIVTSKHGHHHAAQWFFNGRANSMPSDLDLLPPKPERVSRWINLYRFPSGNSLSTIYVSLENADKHADPGRTHVLELIYEGGFFVDVIKHKLGE